jgi:hypothetical protein
LQHPIKKHYIAVRQKRFIIENKMAVFRDAVGALGGVFEKMP